VTAPIPLGVLAPRVRLVADGDYLPALHALIAGAVHRVLGSLFIVDLSPARDRDLAVDAVLNALEDARWRGADVRLLLGGSRTNFDIAQLAELARARAHRGGIPCRWLTSRDVRGSHLKLVIGDDTVLTGSHNWSAGAFSGRETQDSLLIGSPDFAAYAERLFARQWARAGESA
jgi:phosphatidylserine/phosphatidylglycerophosphate/cardiolipin synthase-like enzyme